MPVWGIDEQQVICMVDRIIVQVCALRAPFPLRLSVLRKAADDGPTSSVKHYLVTFSSCELWIQLI